MEFLSLNIGIGLDIGSNSVVLSKATQYGTDIIPNENGQRELPTIISFTKKERLICNEQAQMKLKSNILNSVLMPIRFLQSNLENEKDFIYCKYNLENSGIVFNLNNNNFTEIQILIMLFSKIKECISMNTSLKMCTFTISYPPFFTPCQKELLKNSALIADLPNIKMVSESEAIAYTYINLNPDNIGKNILFIDIGYSKTGIFLANFGKDSLKILNQIYSVNLGVRNLDNYLHEFFSKEFSLANKIENVFNNKKVKFRLFEAIEKHRKILSANKETTISIESLYEDYDFSMNLNREKFQKICEKVFDEFRELIINFFIEINEANVGFSHIEILGGGSRIPFFQKIVEEVFEGVVISKKLHATESLSIGCGMLSNCIWKHLKYPYKVEPSLYYDIIVQDLLGNSPSALIFKKNSSYPIKNNSAFLMMDQILQLQVFVVKNSLKIPIENITISVIKGIKQEKLIVRIIFNIDFEGNFNIISAEIEQDPNAEIEINRESYGVNYLEKDLQNFKKIEENLFNNDKSFLLEYEVKNSFESYVYQLKNKLNENYFNLATQDEKNQLKSIIEKYTNWMENEGINANYEETNKKFSSFVEESNKIVAKFEVLLQNANSQKIEVKSLNELKNVSKSYNKKEVKFFSLNLYNQEIGDGSGLLGFIKTGGKDIASYLQKINISQNLSIDIANNCFTDETLSPLINTITNFKNLEKLSFVFDCESNNLKARNHFSQNCIMEFAMFLPKLNNLKELHLSFLNLTDESTQMLVLGVMSLRFLAVFSLEIARGKISGEIKKALGRLRDQLKILKINYYNEHGIKETEGF